MSEISRRRMLAGSLVRAGAAGGAAFGITRPVHHKVALPPPAPPTALTTALTDHRSLLASYDAVSTAGAAPAALPQLRSDIAAHVDALRAALEAYPGWRLAQAATSASRTPAAAPSPLARSPAPAGTVPALRTAVLAAATRLQASCLSWPAAESQAAQVVPLLGSIVACLATHSEVLA